MYTREMHSGDGSDGNIICSNRSLLSFKGKEVCLLYYIYIFFYDSNYRSIRAGYKSGSLKPRICSD